MQPITSTSMLLKMIDRAVNSPSSPVQHVGVEHRCAHVAMPEQFLNRADVIAVFEQIGGAFGYFCFRALLWGLVLVGALAFFIGVWGLSPQRAWQAYLVNFLFWSGLSLAALTFLTFVRAFPLVPGTSLKEAVRAGRN